MKNRFILLYYFDINYLFVKIGQSTFGKAAYVEPSEVHTSPVHDDEGPANSCATSQLEPKQDASTHSYEQNASGSARNGSGNHSTTPGMANVEITFSGIFLKVVVATEFLGFCLFIT